MGIYDRFIDEVLVNYSTRKTIIYRFCIAGNIARIVSYMFNDAQRPTFAGNELQAIESLFKSFAGKDR